MFLVYIGLAYVAKMIKFPLLGMNDTIWTLILVTVYLIIAFMPMVLNYQYVFFSDDPIKSFSGISLQELSEAKKIPLK